MIALAQIVLASLVTSAVLVVLLRALLPDRHS